MIHRPRQWLHRLGWEFWLPLPLIAVLFWFAGTAVTQHTLRRPVEAANRRQAESSPTDQLVINGLTINAELDRQRNITTVRVRTEEAFAQPQTYRFPTTQVERVEEALAKALDIPPEAVRQLASYRIKPAASTGAGVARAR